MESNALRRWRQPWHLPRPGRFAEYLQARLRAPRLRREEVEQLVAAYNLRLVRAPQNLPFGWRSYNVVLHTDEGKKVLKRYRANWPITTIAHEHAVLRQLESDGFPAPRLALTPGQRSTVQSGNHFFALFDFIDGRNYAGSLMLPAQRKQLLAEAGAALARLHIQLHTFTPPGAHHLGRAPATDGQGRDLAWHLEQLAHLSQQWETIEDPKARAGAQWLAQQADSFARRLQQLELKTAGANLPETIIHGDYGLHNLHFHTQGSQPVTVIDFELARREWRIIDLISLLSRIGLQQGRAFLRAYDEQCRSTAPHLMITEDEWRLLPDIWQLYRLRGAIQYWHTYITQGAARRLRAARERVREGSWAIQQRPELWDLRTAQATPASVEPSGVQRRPLRAMMIVRLFYPWVGGAERQAHRLAQTLLEADTSVELVTGWWFRGTAQRELVDSIPIFRNFTLWHSFDIKGLRKFSGYLYILTLLLHLWRRRHYDVVHVHGLNYHTFAAVLAGRWFRRPVLVKLANSGEASDIKKMGRGQQLALSRFMLPAALRADCFVALNPTITEELVSAGVAREKIVEIPNGVDVARFRAKKDYTLHEPARLVYLGRLHQQKGLEILLDALRCLRQQLPDTPLVLRLIGEGPEREVLQNIARRSGIDAFVEFAGLCHNVAAELESADIFILPSRAEGLSNALLEAMACALPVVASDIAGNRELLQAGKNGLLFAPDDSQALATALRRLLQRPALRQELGCAARRRVEEAYSLDIVAQRYAALYRQLAATNDSSGAQHRSTVQDHDVV